MSSLYDEGSKCHEISAIWSTKHDMNNDTSWHANVDREKLPVHEDLQAINGLDHSTMLIVELFWLPYF